MDFLIYNGKIKKREEVNLSSILFSSSFLLKQKVWFGFGGIPLFYENVESIKCQAEALKLPVPPLFENTRELFRITKRLLNKNKFYRSGYLHFFIFSINENPGLLITCSAFREFDFPFSEEGKLIAVSTQKKHSGNGFNRFGFFNETLWLTTISKLQGTHFQNAVLTNENEVVCECAFFNIFLIQNKQIITPALSTGCVSDTLRPLIFEAASQLKFDVVESDSLQSGDLQNMDELFMASEQFGIQWVMGVENKRFLHRYSTQIHQKLNAFLKAKSAG
jgi:branched-chain amino acid aminotransferase